MMAAEKRVREWLAARGGLESSDVQLLLERLDSYESSITWQTNCHTCPRLFDQIYKMDQHTIPMLRAEITTLRELLKRVLDDARISGADQVSDDTRKSIRDALALQRGQSADDAWTDTKDEWSSAIRAAHPIESDSHEEYAIAMRMVSSRYSKGELVSLINWLLVREKTSKVALDKAFDALHGSDAMRREAQAIGLVDEAIDAIKVAREKL